MALPVDSVILPAKVASPAVVISSKLVGLEPPVLTLNRPPPPSFVFVLSTRSDIDASTVAFVPVP